MEKIILDVPYEDKEIVRNHGAKWDWRRKKWVINHSDKELFRKWIPDYETELTLRLRAPFYVVESQEECYKCGEISNVITFAGSGTQQENNNFMLLSYITALTENVQKFIEKEYYDYFLDFSNTTQSYYYMNHCSNCSARLGDFYMYSEPGGAFFPMSHDEAKTIKLIQLKETGFVKISGSNNYQYPDLISTYGQYTKY